MSEMILVKVTGIGKKDAFYGHQEMVIGKFSWIGHEDCDRDYPIEPNKLDSEYFQGSVVPCVTSDWPLCKEVTFYQFTFEIWSDELILLPL